MADPKKEAQVKSSAQQGKNENEAKVPKKFHIVLTDSDSGKVLLDSTTDIAVIGAVSKDQQMGEIVPTNVFWVGSGQQMEQMIGLIAQVIGSQIYQNPMPGTMSVGRKVSNLKN